MHDHTFDIVPVCALKMAIDYRIYVGDTPEGLRTTGYLTEGTCEGPKINGTVQKGAADFACIRPDGMLVADVKLFIKTDDKAVIQIDYTGVVDMGPDAYRKMMNREPIGTIFHPRTAPRMLCAAPAYAWVNRSQFIGIGLLDYSQGNGVIAYDIYQVSAPEPTLVSG
jgi:hypothetical protein